MTVRRIGRFSVTSRLHRVYLVDDASAADSGLSIDEAISLGEALLLAAREADRFTSRQTRLYHPDEPVCGCAGTGKWSGLSGDSRREDQ